MTKPRYQDIPSSRIPVAQTVDGTVTVKVIAGEALGAHAIIQTRTPIFYLHFTIQPGAKVVQPAPREYNSFAYIISGDALIGPVEERKVKSGQMVVFDNNGEKVVISAAADSITDTKNSALNMLLIGGVPLNEPVGPFVMNTEKEIHKAIQDYRNGKMGKISIQ